jgi:hypothetical protein
LSIGLALALLLGGLMPHWTAAAAPSDAWAVTICGPDGLHTVTLSAEDADTPLSGGAHDCTHDCTCMTCGSVGVARPTPDAEPVAWHPTPIRGATDRFASPVSLGAARPPASRAPPRFV